MGTESGRLKLIFIATRNEVGLEEFLRVASECAKEIAGGLIDIYSARYVTSPPVRVGNSAECERVECSIRVLTTGKLWQVTPIIGQSAADMLKDISAGYQSADLLFYTSVAYQDRNFFDTGGLSGADIAVKAHQCYLGNLVRYNEFVTHFIVENDCIQGRKAKWFGEARTMSTYYNRDDDDRVDLKDDSAIYVDFEHDRRKLNILFPLSIPDTGGGRSLTLDNMFRWAHRSDYSEDSTKMVMYLHLTCPPLINVIKFKRRMGRDLVEQARTDLRTMSGDRMRHWIPLERGSPVHDPLIVQKVAESSYVRLEFASGSILDYVRILGRLVASSCKIIEIRNIVPQLPNRFTVHYSPSPVKDAEFVNLLQRKKKDGTYIEDFHVIYMIEALCSRGAHVKDQLLMQAEWVDQFKENVLSLYREDRQICLETLEHLLAICDKKLDLEPIHELFPSAVEAARHTVSASAALESSPEKQGYVRLRKVVITPTRDIYEAPELIMGNRVLRADLERYPADFFLRVSFRDENYHRINASIGKAFIEKFVRNKLYGCLRVANRKFIYLGSSNSQMRDQGCYFMAATDEDIEEFRCSLGSFKIDSVPKLMARFGQCFTQSHATANVLDREYYTFVEDYVGGKDGNKKEYTFSDGVGCLSAEYASKLANEMKLGDCVPSCFQARFRGFKGVQAMNPVMDKIKKWAETHGITEEDVDPDRRFLYVHLYFRESQKKFITRSDGQKFEIVKISGPSPVCFNRPFINIMDQVSAMQSFLCHKRITSRIFELLDVQLRGIARTMADEREARNRLGEFPRLMMWDLLQTVNLTQEPFFRNLLLTNARCTLKKLRAKLQIAVPADLGRSMLGVIDETGLLGNGQVFVRYTTNMHQKRPGPSASRNIVEGPILISKNPMIVPGDVRMFQAVDIPSLHHMCDVIVFPRHGHRPHTDEMAGSDLDGDEYSVIWDPALFLERNEDPFDYTSAPVPESEPVNENELRKQMADFFVNYISNDSIGKLANAFLVNADLYGINSKLCNQIAKKHMSAVDFPKTGVPAERLCKGDRAKNIPAEDPGRKPDYLELTDKPSYVSTRLNGRLFRRVQAIDDVLEGSLEEQAGYPPKKDPTFIVDNCDVEHKALAEKHFVAYKAEMEYMFERFGIGTEAEIFSNSFQRIRKRLNDKEDDDMSYYNTRRLIEDEVERTFAKYRRILFECFGSSFDSQTEWPLKTSAENEKERRVVLRSICREPSKDLQKLASCCYDIAYSQGDQKFLSFAWLLADVLSKIRRDNTFRVHLEKSGTNNAQESPVFSFDPLSDRLSKHIDDFMGHRVKPKKILSSELQNSSLPADRLIWAYCTRHDGLMDLLYFLLRWAKKNSLVKEENTEKVILEDTALYDRTQLFLTFIQFGLNQFGDVNVAASVFLENTTFNYKETDIVNLRVQHGGLGKKFLLFLEFLASLKFAEMQNHSFKEFELNSTFSNGEWIKLHKAAENSYYQICLTDSLDVLPFASGQKIGIVGREEISREKRLAVDGESFVFELPNGNPNDIWPKRTVGHRLKLVALVQKCGAKLKEVTGCSELFFRSLPGRNDDVTTKFIVSVSGSLESVAALRKLLMPQSFINCSLNEEQLAFALSSQIQHRLENMLDEDDEMEASEFYMDMEGAEDEESLEKGFGDQLALDRHNPVG